MHIIIQPCKKGWSWHRCVVQTESIPAASESPPRAGSPPRTALAWSAVVLLSLAYIVSYADRILITMLVEPIKADLHLSDSQFGALQGIAFGLFYTVMALPIGWLADRRSRRLIAAGGIALFSVFSVASGFARGYWGLFAARVGVGVGEASLTPAAHSMIADYFPPHRLGRAMSVFTLSAFIGIGFAYAGGGATIAWLQRSDLTGLPLIGGLPPWQQAFVIVGMPGFMVAALLLLIREPLRAGRAGTKAMSIREAIGHVRGDRRLLALLFGGFSMVTLAAYAGSAWTPAVFIRVFGWSAPSFGLSYGAMYLVFGTIGAFAAGWLSDMLVRRGVADAPLRVAIAAFVGHAIFGALAPLMSNGTIALAMLAPSVLFGTMPFPLAAVAIQQIAPGRMRAQLSSLYMMAVNVIGLGVGPLIVGVFTDQVFSQPSDVRYSLAIVVGCAAPAGALLLRAALRPYRMRLTRTV